VDHAEGLAEEAAFRVGARPVASLAAYLPAPADYTAYRLLCAVRRKVALDQLPAALGVLPAHHLADPVEVTECWRDLPDALPDQPRESPCAPGVAVAGIVVALTGKAGDRKWAGSPGGQPALGSGPAATAGDAGPRRPGYFWAAWLDGMLESKADRALYMAR
jgi:hypothetical protein